MIFVGTNFGHNSSAAAIDSDGSMLGAVEEGRLIGEKGCATFPVNALNWLLSNRKDKGEPVLWTEGWRPLRRLLQKGALAAINFGWREAFFLKRFESECRRYTAWLQSRKEWAAALSQPKFCGHHRAHAFSLLPAGLGDKAIIVVSDNIAERESVSIFLWFDGRMQRIAQSIFPHSLGNAYHRLAHHLGFYGRTGPGKVMALAGQGLPRFYEDLRRVFSTRDGRVEIDCQVFPAWRRFDAWLQFGQNQGNLSLRELLESAERGEIAGRDLAASMQRIFTDITWALVKWGLVHTRRQLGIDCSEVGLAGGCALNCRANGSFKQWAPSFGIRKLVVSPWSDDSGTSIGAAVWAAREFGNVEKFDICGPFVGPLAMTQGSSTSNREAATLAALEIARGRLVALVSGRLEFGPRALGGRCLLGDPRSIKVRNRINLAKGRPTFMPLAPAVLPSALHLYFLGDVSEHMAWTVSATRHGRSAIPAAIHIDGTARAQAINEDNVPLLASVVRAFSNLTGVAAVLLTSLNRAGEAIPADWKKAREVAKGLGAIGILSDGGWIPLDDSA